MPPERNAPTGTSATMRRRTLSVIARSTASIASASPPVNGAREPAFATVSALHQRSTRASRVARSSRRRCPGSSVRASRWIDIGAGTQPKVMYA